MKYIGFFVLGALAVFFFGFILDTSDTQFSHKIQRHTPATVSSSH
ncbi:MAG: hypothetical protein ACOYI9_09395 [Candidatus Hydrogenedentales bacterium]|jgi:hypothetical protein